VQKPPLLEKIEWKRSKNEDLGVIRVYFEGKEEYHEFGNADLV